MSVIANEVPVIARSLWNATANPAPDWPVLKGRLEAEVAIIGAGFTGLSAALHLAEASVSVVVIEAETPGWGASGRNGGQVNPGLKEDPDEIEARFGADRGGRMVRLSGGAGDFVFDLIRRHGIDCAAAQPGWVQPFHDAASEATVRRRVAQWQRRGAGLRLLDRDEVAAILGTDDYTGGMIDPRGGNLHPLNYALGMAEAAARHGARIFAHSRAESVTHGPDGHVILTAQGRITARRLVMAVNGYGDAAAGALRRTVVPIRSVQVATAPLGDNQGAAILPGGHSASDARRLLLYFRRGPNGEFVMGGRGAYSEGGTLRAMQALRDASLRLYPQLEGADWRYAWGGFVAMTADHYPHLTRDADGVLGAMGYNGRGVAMASAMGKVLADAARGVADADLDFPVTPVRPIPLHFLRRPAVAAAVAWSRLRDAIG